MAEITINGVKYTNVPNKKAGTKFAASLTQSNIGASQAVQDYVNSAYFYPLVNAIDINWNGVEVDENSYINTTSDLISYIASKESNIDLSSYATMTYVDQKITDLIGGAPETLDTLKELADALEDDASLAYVTEALAGKADVNNVYTKQEVDNLIPAPVDLSSYATTSYVTTELNKKADKSDIVQADMCETDSTSKSYVLNNPYKYHLYNLYGTKYYCYNLIIPHNTIFDNTNILDSNIRNCVIIGNNHNIYNNLQYGLIQGYKNKIQNDHEVAFGQYNSSTHSSDNSIRTVFSIGNGTLTTRHNALEVKADGKIYIADTKNGTPYILQTKLNGKADLSYVTTELDKKADKSSLTDYATNSYVTIELDKKADKTDIPVVPDMSNYVTMTAYNMLVQRVDELANLIAYYHPTPDPGPTPTFEGYWTLNGMRTDSLTVSTTDSPITLSFISNPTIASGIGTWTFSDMPSVGVTINSSTGEMTITPSMMSEGSVYSGVGYLYQNGDTSASFNITINVTSGSSKQSAMGQWLNSSSMVENSKTVVAGDSTTYTFTFSGTPSDNWSFNYMGDEVSGLSIDTMTGTITIDMTNTTESTIRHMNVDANRPEDSTYYYGSAMFTVTVLPNGTNPDFYYDQQSVNISNTTGVMTPMLYDSISSRRGYVSSDTTIATVSNDGSINYVSDGTCTVTATAYDSSDNVLATATITVYCETMKNNPSASWSGRNMNGQVVVNAGNTTPVTCVFNGTPASGWTAQPSPDAGITIDSSTMNVTIDATNMTVGEYNVNISYPEDANYYGWSDSLLIRIIPAGANPDFYFYPVDITLAPEESPRTVGIQSNNGYQVDHVSFVSSDTTAVTVNNISMAGMYQCELNWQNEGTSTIVATAYDSSNNVLATASLDVTCTAAQPVLTTPTCHWSCNGVDYNNGENTGWTVDEERTDTFTFTGTPASGWTFNYPTGTGITANTTTGEFTIDTTAISSKGTYTLTASYPGDSTYSSAQYSITITLEKHATAVWKDSNDVGLSQFETNVNDAPTTLTFDGNPSTGWTFNNNDVAGISIDASGNITVDPSGMTPDTYWISAEYPEDVIYSNTYESFAIIINSNA